MYHDAETGIEVQFYLGYKGLIGIIELPAKKKKNLRTYTLKQDCALWYLETIILKGCFLFKLGCNGKITLEFTRFDPKPRSYSSA